MNHAIAPSLSHSSIGIRIRTGLLALPTLPDEPARSLNHHALKLGVGVRYGLVGGSYSFRLDEHLGATVGGGIWGIGAGLRAHPWGPLFAQVGVGPLAASDSTTSYGPDLVAGIDLNRTRISLTVALGCGVLRSPTKLHAAPTIDLGIGVNLGRDRDDAVAVSDSYDDCLASVTAATECLVDEGLPVSCEGTLQDLE